MIIKDEMMQKFESYLINEEKAQATVEKYVHDASVFMEWLGGREINKELAMEYKEHLKEIYAPVSVNAAISSLNSFFIYLERHDLKLKTIKIQKKIFSGRDKELKLNEYKRLMKAAKKSGKNRLFHIMKTIFVTGIRVSELKFITVEAVEEGTAVIDCKGKMREVFLPPDLRNILRSYIKKAGIKSGSIFVTKTGKPVDRSNIAKGMKKLAEIAGVVKKKVFPHNLRHLFARKYYSAYKDIVRLSDVLGHSSINTTRIYTMESGAVHRRQLEALALAAY